MKSLASISLVIAALSTFGSASVRAGTTESVPAVVLQPAPTETEQFQRTLSQARVATLIGTLAPIAIGGGLLSADRPSTPMLVSAGGLYYAGLFWGPSAGTVFAGDTKGAILSGLGKTALAGVGVAADLAVLRRAGEGAHTVPLFTLAALGAVVAWDVADFVRLPTVVKERQARHATSVLPTVAPTPGGGSVGLVGTF